MQHGCQDTVLPDNPELLRELLRHRVHRCKCLPITLSDRQTVTAAIEHTYGTQWG